MRPLDVALRALRGRRDLSTIIIIIVSASIVLASREARAQTPPDPSATQAGTYECPGCLRTVPADAKRCPECGIEFKKVEYQCPRCHASVARDATECQSCGLKFDARPSVEEREKRTAAERSMPEPRDFLLPPPPPKEESIELHGHILTMWRTARMLGDGGGSAQMNELIEDAWISAEHLGLRGLSFHASGLGREDLGPSAARPSDEQAAVFRLREAFFRFESDDERAWANLGRHFVVMGPAREYVDGASAHVTLGDRLGLEAFGGVPVESDASSVKGTEVVGGRIYWRGIPRFMTRTLRDFTIGFSFMDERWRDEPAKRQCGFDLSFSPTWWIDLVGHCYWDLLAHGNEVEDARGALIVRPASGWQFSLDYRYLVPTDLLPKTSMFFSFANDKRHELELRAEWDPTQRLHFAAGATIYYLPNEPWRTDGLTTSGYGVGGRVTERLGAESPYQLFGQLVWKIVDGRLASELGLESTLLEKGHKRDGATVYSASVLTGRLWDRERFQIADKHAALGSVEFMVEAFDKDLFGTRDHSISLTGSLGYEYDRFATFTAGGAFRSTPDFGGTGEGFLKVDVSW